uniref:Putative secreted protein n=1 Tax=Ixodes ricinus TaxID=34613 RepID=A0A6B0V8Z5_IXORI
MPSSRPWLGCCTSPSAAWVDVLLVLLFCLPASLPGSPVPVASPQEILLMAPGRGIAFLDLGSFSVHRLRRNLHVWCRSQHGHGVAPRRHLVVSRLAMGCLGHWRAHLHLFVAIGVPGSCFLLLGSSNGLILPIPILIFRCLEWRLLLIAQILVGLSDTKCLGCFGSHRLLEGSFHRGQCRFRELRNCRLSNLLPRLFGRHLGGLLGNFELNGILRGLELDVQIILERRRSPLGNDCPITKGLCGPHRAGGGGRRGRLGYSRSHNLLVHFGPLGDRKCPQNPTVDTIAGFGIFLLSRWTFRPKLLVLFAIFLSSSRLLSFRFR